MTKISSYYDHELNQFYDAMRLKLHIHRNKGKWEGINLETLLKLLVDEVEELRETIKDGNQIALILEAADVANYAMIIANVAMKIAAGEHTEHKKFKLSEEQKQIFTEARERIDAVPLAPSFPPQLPPKNNISTFEELRTKHAPHVNATREEIQEAIGGGKTNV